MDQAFYPTIDSSTYAIDCTTTSTAALQIAGKGGSVRILNAGSVPVHVRVGEASDVGAAVFPTAGNPQAGFVVAAGVTEIFTLAQDCYVRAITATGTATIYLNRGEGT